MLKETTLSKLATLAKLDTAKLKAAISDEKEVDFDIADDLTVLNPAELKLRDDNQYGKGKEAGSGMLIDGLRKKHSLEFTGSDPEKLVEAIQKKVKTELDTNPDARIVEMTKDLDKAKRTLKDMNLELESVKAEKVQALADSKLLTLLPNNRVKIFDNDQFLTVVKSSIKLETRDGKDVVVRNGEVVKDPKTLEPLPPADAVSALFKEKNWLEPEKEPQQGGRGGGNSNPGGSGGRYIKLSDLHKEMESEGASVIGEAANARIAAAVKENPEMDMRS